MPFFAIIIENDLEKRSERDAVIHHHHDYLQQNADRLLLGGATLDDAETYGAGSLYVIEAETRADAQRFADEDPLTVAKTRKRIEVKPWRLAVIDRDYVFGTPRAGAPIPGQTPPTSDQEASA